MISLTLRICLPTIPDLVPTVPKNEPLTTQNNKALVTPFSHQVAGDNHWNLQTATEARAQLLSSDLQREHRSGVR
jgi:hypothetical protein